MAKGEGLSPEIEKYDAMWRKDPKSRVFAQLADAYRKNGLYDEAINVCQEGLKIHPLYASARLVLGRAYLEMGERDKGVVELEGALRVSPDNLLSLRTLGELYQQEGKLQEALEKFKKAILLNPLDKEVKLRIDEIKAHLTVSTPPPPASPKPKKDDSQAPTLVMEAHVPGGPKKDDSQAPTVVVKAPFLETPTVPPPTPFATAEKPETGEEKPLIAPEEIGGPEEELSLSLADLEEGGEKIPQPVLVVEEISFPSKERDALTTSTLADLYVEQGFFDRAIEIYQKILEAEPHNHHVRAKLTEALARKSATEPERGEPVYVISEEMIPPAGEGGGVFLREVPFDLISPEPLPPLTATATPPSPPPVVLFPPEELARETTEPAVSPLEKEESFPVEPAKARQSFPVMGDTTLMALDKLLSGARRLKEHRR